MGWRALLFLACFAFQARALPSWIDSSHTILLPEEVSRPLSATSHFSLFWWNFLIIETKEHSWTQVDSFCRDLNVKTHALVLKSGCGQDLNQFREILTDWAADQSFREPAPKEFQLKASLNEAISKASLPSDPFLLSLLRMDPLSGYRRLQDLLDSRVQLKFEKQKGYFFDPETNRLVIPMQVNFPPGQTDHTRQLLEHVKQSLAPFSDLRLIGVIGPQASTAANEQQIRRDVEIVGIAGTLLLLLQIAAAIWIGRWRLLLLAPPVLFSTFAASVLTYFIFGSIHGLTLSFGPGIVGLAMDHGLHSCLNTKWRGAWKANWYGLLTTVVALVAMLFSSIPFLRQLMTFSIIGLFLGFGTYWFLHRKFTRYFLVEPLPIDPRPGKAQFAFIIVTLIGLAAGAAFLRPNFSMQQMNYQTVQDFELTKWFFTHLKTKSPLLEVFGEAGRSPLPEAVAQTDFAARHGLQVENLIGYIPGVEAQTNHRKEWTNLCGFKKSNTERTFFSPFWNSICDKRQAIGLIGTPPAYLSDFYSDGKWISLWMTKSDQETQIVKTSYPDAKSLPEIVELFQTLLERETAWMAPLAILLATALLWFYYRKVHLVLLSLIPFFVGIGLFSGVAVLFHFSVSFVSLIAMVMIFGLSLDYGIFATNLYTGQSGPTPHGVWTSVVLAATVTFLGFLPLIFCHHPVLIHLGQALVFGTGGTILGSMWGIPCFYWLYRKATHAP